MTNIQSNGDAILGFEARLQALSCNPTLMDKSNEFLNLMKAANLKSTADALQEKIPKCEQKIADTKSEINQLTKEIEEKGQEFDNLGKKLNENHEAYVSEAKLYYTISGITWDLDKAPNEIAGYTTHSRLKTFALDPSKRSQFSITDHLWNLLTNEP